MDETIELIPIKFEKLMQSRAYACVVLGAEDKKFAIYTDPPSGKSMQLFLAATEKQRPQTHDLLGRIFRGLEIKVKHVVIYELHDTVYFARIFLEQQRGDLLHIVE